ncbi:hypothetical protein PLCT1_00507 [Planctomycetaceae bacterium]|nr:hypothetical protein PLCT1_00507 [Planctomycetaceae bacterium]
MNTCIKWCLLLACALTLGACSGFTVPDLDEEVRNEKIIPADWKPVKLRVGLAPITSDLELDAKKLNVEDTLRWVLTPDEARLNLAEQSLFNQIKQTLSRYKMFERVEAIKGVTAKSKMEAIRQAALDQGFDVVLRPVVKRSDVGYVGTNAAYGWNLGIWLILSPINSWWVADEDFDAFLECDFGLYSAASGKLLRTKRIKPQAPVVKAFDDWDMGFNLFAIFSAPYYFDHENWEKIGGKLMPFADQAHKKQALRYVVNELAPDVKTEDFQSGIRRRVGVFIGVDGNGQHGIPLTRFAGADARELAAALQYQEREPLASATAVSGEQATDRGVAAAFENITKLARANDDMYLSYSGMGTLTPEGKPAVLLAKPEGGYEVTALETLVDRALVNKPRTLVLMLDCAFLAPADGRCAVTSELLAKVAGATPESLLKPLLAKCEAAGTQCIILSASSATPGQANPECALENEELGHGLFSSFVMDGLDGAADADGIGGVTIEELKAYVASNVERIAGFDAKTQKPMALWSESRKGYAMPSTDRQASDR